MISIILPFLKFLYVILRNKEKFKWKQLVEYIRWQSNPFPVKPLWQVQIASPFWLVQSADGWQGFEVQGSGIANQSTFVKYYIRAVLLFEGR